MSLKHIQQKAVLKDTRRNIHLISANYFLLPETHSSQKRLPNMSDNFSDSTTLTGLSAPADQGVEIASTVSLTDLFPPIPRAPPGTPVMTVHRGHGDVFPPYIYINYEGFLRADNPFWQQPERLATSCMYTFANTQAGQRACSDRMAQWLEELPPPNNRQRHGQNLLLLQQQQQQHLGQPTPGALSTPPGFNLHGNGSPMMPTNSTTGAHTLGLPSMAGPSSAEPEPEPEPEPAVPDVSTLASLHHPNPLSQHPVRLHDVPIELRIPKRKSSLRHSFRDGSLDADQSAINPDEELVQAIQSIDLGEPVEFLGNERHGQPDESSAGTRIHHDITMVDAPLSPPVQTSDAAVQTDNSKRKSIGVQVTNLFGGENKKKHGRSEVRFRKLASLRELATRNFPPKMLSPTWLTSSPFISRIHRRPPCPKPPQSVFAPAWPMRAIVCLWSATPRMAVEVECRSARPDTRSAIACPPAAIH